MNDFGSQIVSSLLVVKFLEWLKTTGWYQNFATAMPMNNRRVHQIVSAVGAFISALGIHIAFQGTWHDGWHFAGTIPAGPELVQALWAWAQQFMLNQGIFDIVYKQFPSATVTIGNASVTGPADRILPPAVKEGAGV